MIELGKYGTDFIVSKSDIDNPTDRTATNYLNGSLYRLVYDRCSYKGFGCWIKQDLGDSLRLQLITLTDKKEESNDFIPIVI